MPDSVQYERLRPAQIVSEREACPVAYLPIGTLEWHGALSAPASRSRGGGNLSPHAG